ncbi:efflux transporter outer membrane subunit [Methylomonas sp. AM2-LC]|uniref:efflux transporter outer membrane subunit n=1 Tax=Methylomonas sp. AM2-LC TaxID=3153301 RepID=UPI003266EB86
MPDTKHLIHPLFSNLANAKLLAMLLCLPACFKVGPDYQPPAPALPQRWHAVQDQPASGTEASTETEWWQHFHDPVLTQLIDTAERNNFDVKLASGRIAEARALRAGADAALFPTGDMAFNANRQRNQIGFPNSVPNGITSALKNPFNIFKIGFDASWELDLFGGHRREAESASAELAAAEISQQDVLISTRAEVAHSYITIRLLQAQLKIATDTLAADTETTRINSRTLVVGSNTGLNVARVTAQQQHDETQLPYYRSLLEQSEYSLDVLLAAQPGTAHDQINTLVSIPGSDDKLLLAAPANVIAQRPDIRYAERKLAAATAQQGVAVAKFFPDVSLVGFIGLFNTNAGNLLQVSSKSWNMGGNVLWPILSYGTLSANLHAADARQQEALTSYQKSIITAMADVERSVAAYREQDKLTKTLQTAVATDENIYQITQGRYQAGLGAYLEVLDAQRKLYASQNQLLAAQAQTTLDLIAVYKSLGGGWKPEQLEGIK